MRSGPHHHPALEPEAVAQVVQQVQHRHLLRLVALEAKRGQGIAVGGDLQGQPWLVLVLAILGVTVLQERLKTVALGVDGGQVHKHPGWGTTQPVTPP
jgi:hypothetical protein